MKNAYIIDGSDGKIDKAIALASRLEGSYWASISVGDSNRGYSHGIVSWLALGTPKRFLTKRIDGRKDEIESVLAQVIGLRPGEHVLTATSGTGDRYNANVTVGYNAPRSTHGGKRNGAGRKPATKARCVCGKHTLARAIRLRLKCRA
jgi:hypothetical protein